jgi:hypothetical protein
LAWCEADANAVISATHALIGEGTASAPESASKAITGLKGEGPIRPGYRSIASLSHDRLGGIAQHTTAT